MNCDVWVYENTPSPAPTLAPISSPTIDATMSTYYGALVDHQPVGPPPYPSRATLGPVPAATVVEVLVDDTKFQYAPAVLPALNGDHTKELHVTLLQLPAGVPPGGGRPPSGGYAALTTDAVGLVNARVEREEWSAEEGVAVLSLHAVALYALASQETTVVRPRLAGWLRKLEELGIAVVGTGEPGPSRTPPARGTPGTWIHREEPLAYSLVDALKTVHILDHTPIYPYLMFRKKRWPIFVPIEASLREAGDDDEGQAPSTIVPTPRVY